MFLMAVDENYYVQLYAKSILVKNITEGNLDIHSEKLLFNEALKVFNNSKDTEKLEAARDTLKLYKESKEKIGRWFITVTKSK